MKKQDKKLSQVSLDEINAAIKATKKSIDRKTYLLIRKWYKIHESKLKALGYKKKIEKLNKHKLKREIADINGGVAKMDKREYGIL